MYNLPENEDLSFLRDKDLELVCFAAYQVNLHFVGGVLITIFGSFQHLVASRSVAASNAEFPMQNSELMRLLMKQVKQIIPVSDGTLTLAFSNGDKLIIKGDNGPYESYHIKHGENLIVV